MLISAAAHQLISTVSPFTTALAFTLVVLLIACVYWFGYGRFQHFKKDGLIGPEPEFFFGSTLALAKSKFQTHSLIDSYYKKYGKVFGFYFNSRPTVVVADPDMVKQILVKDFAKFHDREPFIEPPRSQESMLFFAQGERWKFIRNTLTPSFTSGKMRLMSGLMNRVADRMVAIVKGKAEENEVIDFLKLQQGATMETILCAAFGVEAQSQTDGNDKITEAAKAFFRIPRWVNLLFILPLSRKWAKYIPWALGTRFDRLANIARTIIAQRKRGGAKRQDSLQFMLEAQQTPDPQTRPLTDDEIVAQCVVFLAAGYETSSTTLAMTCYHLAVNPEIQQRLYKEIIDCCPKDNIPDYDIVQKMVFLDQVISETLRLCPPAFILLRSCNEDCVINGTKFRSGYNVLVPVYSIHHDVNNWDDPETFDPDRFSPEAKASRNPYTYLPFGHGPHHCIGMRFAQMEMKIVLARLLKEFRLEKAKETPVPLVPVCQATLTFTEPIKLRVVKREAK